MIFWVIIIWAKATFFFQQLFPVVARTWLESKSGVGGVYVNPNNDGFIVIGRLAGNVKIHKIAPYHDSLAVLL